MARTLSVPAFKAMFAQETDEVFLICLKLEHASFDAPLRVVNNNRKIVRADGDYLPAVFTINLPEESSDRIPEVTLSFDNVDAAISELIRTISGRVKVTLDVVLASSPDTVEAGPFTFWILACSYDSNVIQGTLGFEDDVLNTVFPGQTYTPNNSPGLFK